MAFTRVAATNHWFNQTAAELAEMNDVVLWDLEHLKDVLTRQPMARFEVQSFMTASLNE
jgi:hypothetical protein